MKNKTAAACRWNVSPDLLRRGRQFFGGVTGSILFGRRLFCCCFVLSLLASSQPVFAAEPVAFTKEFIRFVNTGRNEGHVDTATKSYRRERDQVTVSLVSVVHVGDRVYYEALQKLFESYDAVLYEMIRDRDVEPSQDMGTDHPVSQLQIGMKTLLELEFQLDRIDYGRTNFVHADLDPATFASLQAERGESIFGLLFKAALEEQRRQSTDPNAGLNPFAVLFALTADDSARQLKFLLGQQMGQMENMLAGIDQTADGKGSAILSGRNEHVMKVLAAQTGQGRKKLAIFYGAGHMPDLEKRLIEEDFKQVGEDWQTAWDIRRPKRSPAPPSN